MRLYRTHTDTHTHMFLISRDKTGYDVIDSLGCGDGNLAGIEFDEFGWISGDGTRDEARRGSHRIRLYID